MFTVTASLTRGCDNEMTAELVDRVARTALRRRGAALEDAILEAAFVELSEVGYRAFTVESVAARARTGKASIYRRWPTRSELMLDAVCAHLPTPAECGFPEQLCDQLPDDLSTADALRSLAGLIAGVFASPAGSVMRTIKCEATNDPELASAIDIRFQGPRRASLMALFRRGVERGEVRPGADSAVVADVLPAVLMHRFVLQGEPVSSDAVIEVIDQVLLPLIEVR